MKDINSFRVELLQIHEEQTLRTMKKVAVNYLPGASNCSSRSSRRRRRSGGVQCTWNFSLMSAAPAARRKPIRCSCCPWVSRLSILTMMPIQEHKRFLSLATRPGTTCSWSRRRSSGACLSLCWCISSAVIKYNLSSARWLPTFNSDPFFPWHPIPLVACATGSWCRKLICFFMRLGENGHLYVPYSEFLATRMPESILYVASLISYISISSHSKSPESSLDSPDAAAAEEDISGISCAKLKITFHKELSLQGWFLPLWENCSTLAPRIEFENASNRVQLSHTGSFATSFLPREPASEGAQLCHLQAGYCEPK